MKAERDRASRQTVLGWLVGGGGPLGAQCIVMAVCALLLAACGGDGSVVYQDEIARVRGGSGAERGSSVIALGGLGSLASQAVAALAAALDDEDAWVRDNAAKSLTTFGDGATAAVPALVKRLGAEQRSGTRFWIILALERIRGNAELAVPALARSLQDPDESNAGVAATALAAYGPRAAAAVPALLRRVREDGWDMLYVFRLIGPGARPAVPFLVDVLLGRDETFSDMRDRSNAARALGAIGDIAARAPLELAAGAGVPEAREALEMLRH